MMDITTHMDTMDMMDVSHPREMAQYWVRLGVNTGLHGGLDPANTNADDDAHHFEEEPKTFADFIKPEYR